MSLTRDQVLNRLSVSRETTARLDLYVERLLRWQTMQNLVAPSTVPQLWHRHILDSAQLLPWIDSAKTIVDLGSGAGFPGLVLAILLADRSATIHLVESHQRKAAFLHDTAQALAVPALVHAARIEAFAPQIGAVDLITARALAPLSALLELSEPLLKTESRALFLKGREVKQELAQASQAWQFDIDLATSQTEASGRIVHLRHIHRRLGKG